MFGARRLLHRPAIAVPGLSRPRKAGGNHRFLWSHVGAFQGRSRMRLRQRLRAEEKFAREVLRPTTALQMELYNQMASRLPSELISAPEPIGDYDYYTRTMRRRDLPLFCRRRRQPYDAGVQSEAEEEVILDLAALADTHGYAGLGAMSVSSDASLLAYTIDLTGAEEWELRVVELASGAVVSTRPGVMSVEWSGGEQLVYTEVDERGRPCRALLHSAGSAARGSDAILLEEADEAAVLDVAATKGRAWLTLNSNTRTSSEVHLFPTQLPPYDSAPTHQPPPSDQPRAASPASAATSAPSPLSSPPLQPSSSWWSSSWVPSWAHSRSCDPAHPPRAHASRLHPKPRSLPPPHTSSPPSPRLVAPRVPGVTYFVEQLTADGWLLLIGNDSADSRALGLSAVHASELPSPRDAWRRLRPADAASPVDDLDVFADHVVLYERSDEGVPRARVLSVEREGGAPPKQPPPQPPPSSSSPPPPSPPSPSQSPQHSLQQGDDGGSSPPRLVDSGFVPLPSGSAPCALTPAPNRRFDSAALHFTHSSPLSPPTSYYYDLSSGILAPRAPPSEPPPSAPLVCERTYATARDGASIPLTLIRSAEAPPTASTPLHCLVYGAYGASLAAEWRAEHLPLLERGWAVCLVHVRGGGELGPAWHAAATHLTKGLSARDFADSVRSLHARGVSSPPMTTAAADSAGALALGGALNEAESPAAAAAEGRPLLAAALVRGGFLDPLSAMLDPSLPLALEEREEWGDPAACGAIHEAMAAYSPLDGLRPGGPYPAMMLAVAENDVRVPFTHSLDYLSRLRELSPATAAASPPQMLLLRETGGHLGEGGRYRRLEQASVEGAFLIHAVGQSPAR